MQKQSWETGASLKFLAHWANVIASKLLHFFTALNDNVSSCTDGCLSDVILLECFHFRVLGKRNSWWLGELSQRFLHSLCVRPIAYSQVHLTYLIYTSNKEWFIYLHIAHSSISFHSVSSECGHGICEPIWRHSSNKHNHRVSKLFFMNIQTVWASLHITMSNLTYLPIFSYFSSWWMMLCLSIQWRHWWTLNKGRHMYLYSFFITMSVPIHILQNNFEVPIYITV